MPDENHATENPKSIPGSGNFLGCGGCVWAVVGLFVVLFAIALLLPAVSSCRPAVYRMQCSNNLKQIGLALYNYQNKFGCYPPAYTVDEHGRRMHSWRALILPFMEDANGKLVYDFSQPWNSPENLAFAENSPLYQIYYCPAENSVVKKHRDTSYVMLVGPNAFAEGSTPRTKEDITDGLDHTIAVGEMSHSGIFWTEPRDLNTEEMSSKLNDPNQIGLRSDHSGGLYVLFADGMVQFLSAAMDPKIYHALTTINGGEKIEGSDW